MQVTLSPQDLAPLVETIVERVVARLHADQAALGEAMAFSEETAAKLIELEYHVLRDERRRGGISASRIVGRRVRYTRADLLTYLAARREPEK
jgi:hypothetical protein